MIVYQFVDLFPDLEVASCTFLSISALNSLQGSHTTSGDTLHVHPLPQVQDGHLHLVFVHLLESLTWSIAAIRSIDLFFIL